MLVAWMERWPSTLQVELQGPASLDAQAAHQPTRLPLRTPNQTFLALAEMQAILLAPIQTSYAAHFDIWGDVDLSANYM